MKPKLEHLPLQAEESFVVKFFDYDYYPTPWHFHPEYELVLVTESTGKRFIGDDIRDFMPGDLAFIGPHLPHLYRNDSAYFEGQSSDRAKSIVIHFLKSSFGESFFALPESRGIKTLLENSVRGFQVVGNTNKVVAAIMHEMCEMKGMKRWLKLVEILEILASSNELQYISRGNLQGSNEGESTRINTIFEFVMKNFHREISLSEVADIVSLSENSFSRFFSKRTRKTFVSFVNEVRLSHACKLLSENKLSVTDVSLECGFSNLSNFNRQFKKVYQTTPLAYRKLYN
jgi:AraC-like DNA-binding protein